MEGEKQYHIALGPKDIGRYVILPGDPGRVPKIAALFDKAEKVAQNREYTAYTGEVDGIRVSCMSTGIGCPSAAIGVEELIRIGADTLIRVGTAGSLQREVKIGQLVVSTATVREDGTSLQYVPLNYPAVADFETTLALRDAAAKLGYPVHLGISQTKDAFYTEEAGEDLPLASFIRERWITWQKANVLASSMEASALFTVASIRRVRAGEVLAIIGSTYADSPIVDHTMGVEEAIRTAIEAVKILHERDSKKA